MNSTDQNVGFNPARYYVFIVPIFMCCTSIALIGNLYLLLCIRWVRSRAMTANLRLSLSLAGSDAWAAFLLLKGFVANNVVPHLFHIWFGDWMRCYFLVLELLRVAGLITSAVHLLALALNHCFSIISPLKYQTTVTPSFSYVCMCLLWIFPILITLLLASTYEGDGFRASMCGINFYFRFRFRLCIFIQFIIPLLIMLLIYSYILIRLSAARRRCALLKVSHHSDQLHSYHSATSPVPGPVLVPGLGPGPVPVPVPVPGPGPVQTSTTCVREENRFIPRRSLPFLEQIKLGPKSHKQSDESMASVFTFNRLSSVTKKMKAITTTLLILGTFVIGWMPAVSVFILVCNDCRYALNANTQRNVFVANLVANTMIIAKLVLNPFIYAYRLKEIRYALWVMHATRFGRRPLDINRLPSKFRHMAPSLNAIPKIRNKTRCAPTFHAPMRAKTLSKKQTRTSTSTNQNGVIRESARNFRLQDVEGHDILGILLQASFDKENLLRIDHDVSKAHSWHDDGTSYLLQKQ